MKIISDNTIPLVKFDLAEFGDVCYYGKNYYFHILEVSDIDDNAYNAVNLITGELEYIDPNEGVIVFPNAELNI